MTNKSSHHHGNLRSALIDASIELLAETGANALSIRKAAARAGVSHAAPAHHFPTLAHLRAAVAAEGHRRFTHAMQSARAAAAPDPQAQVVAAARGYLAFARAHPGLFDVMFTPQNCEIKSDERVEAATCSYEVLADIARPFAGGDPAQQALIELRIWSMVHGFAALTLSGETALDSDLLLDALLEGVLPPQNNPSNS